MNSKLNTAQQVPAPKAFGEWETFQNGDSAKIQSFDPEMVSINYAEDIFLQMKNNGYKVEFMSEALFYLKELVLRHAEEIAHLYYEESNRFASMQKDLQVVIDKLKNNKS